MEPLPSMVVSLLLLPQQRQEASGHFIEGQDGLKKPRFLLLQRHLGFRTRTSAALVRTPHSPALQALPSPAWGHPLSRATHTQRWKTSSVGWGAMR